MSVRSAERSKAVRLAWEREQELVAKGKCTRDWTREQQQDILDPEKGKAYDDEGRAFEGQHMKSVKQYPEYADNPDNIQFLTKNEHLEAHKGNWKNPTNWNYNPVTKEFHEFGEDELIPCEIFHLSNPIIIIVHNEKNVEVRTEEDQANTSENNGSESNEKKSKSGNTFKSTSTTKVPKSENGLIKGLKAIGRFVVEHPAESFEILGVVAVGIANGISAIGNRKNNINSDTSISDSDESSSNEMLDKSDIGTTVAEIIERANRSSPREHEVPGHKQRYHTKNGVEWREKDSYSRGGKNE